MANNEDVLGGLWPEVGDWQSQYARSDDISVLPSSEFISIRSSSLDEDLEETEGILSRIPAVVGGLASKLGSLFGLGRESALPDYDPTTQVQITESGRESWARTIGEGALEGSGVGAMKTLVKPSIEAAPYLFKSHPYPLAADLGREGAAFWSNNPAVSASYAGPEWDRTQTFDPIWKGGPKPSGEIHPARLLPRETVEIGTGRPGMGKYPHKKWPSIERPVARQREWPEGFSTAAGELRPGQAQVVRDIVDPGYRAALRYDPQRLFEFPGDQWATPIGTKVVPAGEPLTYKGVGELFNDAAKRVGVKYWNLPPKGVPVEEFKEWLARPRVSGEVDAWKYPWEAAYVDPNRPPPLYLGPEGGDFPTYEQTKMGVTRQYYQGLSEADADKIIAEIPNDPKFKGQKGELIFRGLTEADPRFRTKLKRFLKAGARGFREAFKLKNLATGAGQGALVGGVSAAGGRKAGELQTTQTGGTVTPPHPMYAQAGEEGMLTLVQRQEEIKEQWRRQLLNKAISEHGIEAVEGLLPESTTGRYGEIEDLRPSELMVLVGGPDIDLRKPPPLTLVDIAEEALSEEEARAESGTVEGRASATLRDYKDVPFVNRILNPDDYPVIKKGDKDQTVLLGTIEMDGTHYAVPDIVYDGEKLVKRKPGEDRGEWGRRQVEAGNAVPFDTAEEAAEFAEGSWKDVAPKEQRGDIEPLFAPPKDPSIEGQKTAWKGHPDWSPSEWRARVQDSWDTSFEKGGANAKSFIRNIKDWRPDWSQEKVDRFYYEEVMPGVLDTIKNVKYMESERSVSYYARGLTSLKSELGFDSYIDEYGHEITNLGMPPVGHPEQVGEIYMHPSSKDDFATISHEYSHAVNEAIEAILERSDDYSQGQYGDIGSDLLRSNRWAVRGAFPFIGTQKLYGKTVKSGGHVQHHYRYAELADNIRDIRRHLGRDPTADELDEYLSKLSGQLTDDRGRGPGEYSEVGLDDLTMHYLPTPEETEERIRRGEGDRLEHPILDRETGLPIEGEEPWIENILDDQYREGTPSPEDIAEFMRQFSYYRPMTGALTREFG